ncbi:MAG: LysM peptidoglycan-binding domain-containing protein [Candidatus Saccharibacteria bacterium]|nr:LysM peptidoglycan-binding domain-containing protein [Candidatus Saccharibacteria bacterium]
MKRFQLLLSRILPYVGAFLLIFALMSFGSRVNESSIKTPIIAAFNDNSFLVTADQISESYIVANIANTVSLPSTATISENYATVNAIYESTGTTNTSSTIIERPIINDTSNQNRGIITHTVEAGETIASILKKYNITGVTENQIRWSNKMKTATLTAGQKLLVPTVPGIIYTTKKGDTYDGIAKKYKSNTEEIIIRNDLEYTAIAEGMTLLLPDGELPETERPEYVAPKPVVKPRPTTGGSSYIAISDSGIRKNRFQVQNYNYWRNMYYSTKSWNNPGAFGNCTWFAWYWRRANMPSNYWLPTGVLGHARSWNTTLASRGFPVGHTPAYGAVVQTSTSGYGHVAVVTGVNPGVSITIQEMNYAGPNGKFNIVYQSTIDWQYAVKFNYIYGK